MALLDVLVALLIDNLLYIIVFAGIIFGVYFVYTKFLRKIPKNPDYVKIWQEKNIEDEKFNKPDSRFGAHWLFRGERLLGKIITFDNFVKMKVNTTPENPGEYREGTKGTPAENKIDVELGTVTFKPHTTGRFYLGKLTMMKFLKEDVIFEGRRIIIPENFAITALGSCYFVHQSLPAITKSIEANWSRRFSEAQANAFGNQMLKVSGFVTEYAQERRLRELEIEKLKMEKTLKMGSVI